ncbi:22710_t:CDS:2, partial [Gigaspora rosea]
LEAIVITRSGMGSLEGRIAIDSKRKYQLAPKYQKYQKYQKHMEFCSGNNILAVMKNKKTVTW